MTYNGRGFDWPLLVARYRLHGRPAPVHAGHLDLLPIVRRLFRHRMADARLRTAEAELLGIRRHGDVDGWEIPGRYLEFLRGGSAAAARRGRPPQRPGRPLARRACSPTSRRGLGDRRTWDRSHPGDLAGLARSFARQGDLAEALECLDIATGRCRRRRRARSPPRPSQRVGLVVAAAAGRTSGPGRGPRSGRPGADPRRTRGPGRIAIERAHGSSAGRATGARPRALGGTSWTSPAGPAIVAAIELAKLHEHQFDDLAGALQAATDGLGRADWRRRIGHPEPALERDLRRRIERLRRRSSRRHAAATGASDGRRRVSPPEPPRARDGPPAAPGSGRRPAGASRRPAAG